MLTLTIPVVLGVDLKMTILVVDWNMLMPTVLVFGGGGLEYDRSCGGLEYADADRSCCDGVD